MSELKSDLHEYLRSAREALLWKLDGLSAYDLRRPLTPTGTNLLGLVKHLAYVELGYFGEIFGRPSGIPLPWTDPDFDPHLDMAATADESRSDIVALYRTAWAHADATIDALPIDAPATVAHWPGDNRVTLHRILVHVATETYRHAGHADIVRELIDGAVGRQADKPNMARAEPDEWAARWESLERLARSATD
jgi:uncharacterized damage-inducible protein DinB